MAGPEGLAVAGTLDWLFPGGAVSEREQQRPLGVAPELPQSPGPGGGAVAVPKKSRSDEPWFNGRGNLSGNADLLLDSDLLVDFQAVKLVKRTLKVKHSAELFQTLADIDAMKRLGFSLHCVPSKAQEQVLVPQGNTLTLGHVLPKRWLLTVYYQVHRRVDVESALTQMGYSISGCREVEADATVPMDQLLMHRHGCQRYGLWVRQGEDIEVHNGRALDTEMRRWQASYEGANLRAIGPTEASFTTGRTHRFHAECGSSVVLNWSCDSWDMLG